MNITKMQFAFKENSMELNENALASFVTHQKGKSQMKGSVLRGNRSDPYKPVPY